MNTPLSHSGMARVPQYTALVIMSMSGGVDEWENYASIRGAAYKSVPV